MTENMNKLLQLLDQNPEAKEKALAALKSLSAEASEEAMLNSVFAPLAREAGIPLTLEDVKGMAELVAGEDAVLSAKDLEGINGGGIFTLIPRVQKVVEDVNEVIEKIKKKQTPGRPKGKPTKNGL